MVKTEQFYYFRLQKTASRFLGELFKYVFNSSSTVAGNHTRRRHINGKDRIFVSSIRNPWDWYVSFYFSHIDKLNKTGKIRKIFKRFFYKDNKLLDFNDFMRHICSSEFVISSLYRLDIGYYSYRFLDILGGKKVSDFKKYHLDNITDFLDIDYFIRFEDIPNDIVRFMEKNNISYDKIRYDNFLNKDKIYNKSNRGHYSDYYEDDVIELVRHKDRMIINNFKYKYEEADKMEV